MRSTVSDEEAVQHESETVLSGRAFTADPAVKI